jgi:hypothetical protein
MTHVLTAAHFAGLPPWLTEGLAEYHETLRVEESSVVIGMPNPFYLATAEKRLVWPDLPHFDYYDREASQTAASEVAAHFAAVLGQ